MRGLGLMLRFASGDAASVQSGARAEGVIVRASGADIVLSPPLVISEEQLDKPVQVLIRQVRAVGWFGPEAAGGSAEPQSTNSSSNTGGRSCVGT
ncbi:hypothetical protein [Spongiactinospora sp. 9N601]|uniref:hypothetical protein n=1 Tax=Spongiactinospora sp. 9N601 TaxID=3375149 RepID=UPI0037A61EDE